jgi:hypothetical protein
VNITKAQRELLRLRSQGVCELCGADQATNFHHRKNRSQGGGNELSNAMHLCGSGTTGCHGHVTENPALAYRFGWSVKSFADPAETLVKRKGQWVLLDDLGYVTPVVEP